AGRAGRAPIGDEHAYHPVGTPTRKLYAFATSPCRRETANCYLSPQGEHASAWPTRTAGVSTPAGRWREMQTMRAALRARDGAPVGRANRTITASSGAEARMPWHARERLPCE